MDPYPYLAIQVICFINALEYQIARAASWPYVELVITIDDVLAAPSSFTTLQMLFMENTLTS
jgi:hypothetical protein